MHLNDADEPLRLLEHVTLFRDQTQAYLNGDLSEEDFRSLRLLNGLYRLRETTMLRVGTPQGRLSSEQLRRLARITRDYGLGEVHLTTRQTIQFTAPEIAEVPQILAELAEVGLSSFLTSGNGIRGIAIDPLAGLAEDELEDPRPWHAILDQWRQTHPLMGRLPRKFKIAIHGARTDRVTLAAQDLGLELVRDTRGELGFRVLVGGGLGRGPQLAQELTSFVHWPHLLTWIEAILRVYVRDGRQSDPYKSRLKNLVQRLGLVEFRTQVESEWAPLRDGPATLTQAQIERVARRFVESSDAAPNTETRIDSPAPHGPPEYLAWRRQNVQPHRRAGYAIVTLSTKRPGVAPGNLSPEQLERIADWAATESRDEVRLTPGQNLLLTQVRADRLHALWEAARTLDLDNPNGLLTDLVACPGARECDLAHGDSLGLAAAIQARFAAAEDVHDIGPLDLRISGCVNACAHHNLAAIGIRGLRKQGESRYQILIGGRSGREARLAEPLGPSFAAGEVPDAVAGLIALYRRHRQAGETFDATVQRLGTEPFRTIVTGSADAAPQETSHD
ncbi:nitrite/sulfite reductase [Allochromatium palmeri]|uniref:Nitrite/sulfite reductase n=1 Tax=Allochromatium palmeri TaxID=231048 RepID=A0A6N8EFS8_9GAMM|nr:nitrite/sulfite reductase [Allochromatium palmeri]MTW21407.1 nitrite/sulfite reductase [Allochromatium palmeri]